MIAQWCTQLSPASSGRLLSEPPALVLRRIVALPLSQCSLPGLKRSQKPQEEVGFLFFPAIVMSPCVPSTGIQGRWGLLKWHLSPSQAIHPNSIFPGGGLEII